MESVRYADVRRKEEDGRILKTAAGKQKGKHDQSQSLLLRDLGGIKSFLGTTSEAEQDYENHSWAEPGTLLRENCSEPTCGTFLLQSRCRAEKLPGVGRPLQCLTTNNHLQLGLI